MISQFSIFDVIFSWKYISFSFLVIIMCINHRQPSTTDNRNYFKHNSYANSKQFCNLRKSFFWDRKSSTYQNFYFSGHLSTFYVENILKSMAFNAKKMHKLVPQNSKITPIVVRKVKFYPRFGKYLSEVLNLIENIK